MQPALFDLIEFVSPNYSPGKLDIEIEIFHFQYGRLIRCSIHRAVASKVAQFCKFLFSELQLLQFSIFSHKNTSCAETVGIKNIVINFVYIKASDFINFIYIQNSRKM